MGNQEENKVERAIRTDGGQYFLREYSLKETTILGVANQVSTSLGGDITIREETGSSSNLMSFSDKQNLALVAAEIQKLLEQLERENPTATEEAKITYINDEISPGLKHHAVSALKATGEAAIDEFLDTSCLQVGKAAVKSWLEAE